MGEIFQNLLIFLFATDIIWGTFAALYVIVALPIGLIVVARREKKKRDLFK